MHSRIATSAPFRSTVSEFSAIQFAIASALLFLATIAIPLEAQQQPAEPPAAPVPSQILSAHKVFIANAAGDHDPRVSKYFGGSDGLYNQFYADIKSGGKFRACVGSRRRRPRCGGHARHVSAGSGLRGISTVRPRPQDQRSALDGFGAGRSCDADQECA